MTVDVDDERLTPRLDSHLPVLHALGAALPVRTVVEYGPGLASTPTWLDRAYFPTLEHLLSYEDDEAWFIRLRDELPPDPRWTLAPVRRGNTCFEAPPLPRADVIFIDAGTADSRVALVATLLGHPALVVLHDYDGPSAYQLVAGRWPHRFVYAGTRPLTAILSMTPVPPALKAALESR